MNQNFELWFLDTAKAQIQAIENDSSRKNLVKQIKKALRHLSENPNYPGLKSHPIKTLDAVYGVRVFTSYVQNNTPQAHRILWYYGSESKRITVLAVIPHY